MDRVRVQLYEPGIILWISKFLTFHYFTRKIMNALITHGYPVRRRSHYLLVGGSVAQTFYSIHYWLETWRGERSAIYGPCNHTCTYSTRNPFHTSRSIGTVQYRYTRYVHGHR